MTDDATRSLTIECGSCPVRGTRCADCMVTALESSGLPTPLGLPLDGDERQAVGALVRSGLVSERAAVTLRARPRRSLGRLGRAAG